MPKYNGWSNSATWCIYMEITNNQTLYRLVMAHKGKMTIEDVPERWRAEVQAMLDFHGEM